MKTAVQPAASMRKCPKNVFTVWFKHDSVDASDLFPSSVRANSLLLFILGPVQLVTLRNWRVLYHSVNFLLL